MRYLRLRRRQPAGSDATGADACVTGGMVRAAPKRTRTAPAAVHGDGISLRIGQASSAAPTGSRRIHVATVWAGMYFRHQLATVWPPIMGTAARSTKNRKVRPGSPVASGWFTRG